MPVSDLLKQITHGVIGLRLMEELSDTPRAELYPRNYKWQPKNEYERIENLELFLWVVKKQKGIRLVNVGERDLLKGDQKLVLGLTWEIMLRFEIQRALGQQDLLEWIKRVRRVPASSD